MVIYWMSPILGGKLAGLASAEPVKNASEKRNIPQNGGANTGQKGEHKETPQGLVNKMPISKLQFQQMQENVSKGKMNRLAGYAEPLAERETGKGGLHQQVLAYCDSKWPRWMVIYARTDKPSTLPVGSPDLTILLPNGKLLLVELKAKGKKPTTDQMAWHIQAKMIGHKVHVVRSLDELKLLTGDTPKV